MSHDIAVSAHTLNNGLKVLLIPSRRVPVIALQGWIRFGSADETDDIAGIAHLFEHLLFKGTEKRKVGQVAFEVESLGGDLNAYTSFDETVMHMTLPSTNWRGGLEVLSDALLHSTVDADELERERPVILEEIRRRNDNPAAAAADAYFSTLFQGHTYSRPIIGFDHVVEKVSRDKIISVYKENYTTKNVFLTIAGDFDQTQVLAECEALFASMSQKNTSRARPALTKLTSSREHFVTHPTYPNALMRLGWRAPAAKETGLAAIDAFAMILGQGESSRLFRSLVLDLELVRDVSASSWNAKDGGAFSVGMKLEPTSVKHMNRIRDQIFRSVFETIRPEELEKARLNLLASSTYSKESVDGLASRFGSFEASASDHSLDARYFNEVNALDIESVEEARDRIFKDTCFVTTGIVPKKSKIPKLQKPDIKIDKLVKAKRVVRDVNVFDFHGLKVLVQTSKQLPIFSARMVSLGGSRLEDVKESGIGTLWARTVTSGFTDSSGRSWTQEAINKFVDSHAASLSAFFGRNSQGFSVDGLAQDYEKLVPMLFAAHRSPNFEKSIVDLERRHQIQDLVSAADSPSSVGGRLLHEAFFGKHPYARSTNGTPASVKKLKNVQLTKFHKKTHGMPHVFCVSGDISAERVLKSLEDYLSDFKFTLRHRLEKPIPFTAPKTGKKLEHKMKKEQAHLFLAVPGVTLKSSDRWAALGLSALLSGQSGRLFIELRDKESLCYTVAPMPFSGLDGGYFAFYIACAPEKVDQALAGLKREMLRLHTDPIPKEEWERSMNYYLGSYLIEQQRLGSQATGLALDELYGLGLEEYFNYEARLRALKPADLQKLASRLFSENAIKQAIFVRAGA